MENFKVNISIPTDEDGFVLLKCPLCNELFKLLAEDLNADAGKAIWCPSCGMQSESYLSDEAKELARQKAINVANEMIYKELKRMERCNKGILSVKTNRKAVPTVETILVPTIDNLEVRKYNCCKKIGKVSEQLIINLSYCPFCGGMNDEYE